ncbi:MAG: dephospho-CoA kinase [Cellulomonas sp. 73-145]|uniref:dephospho-CoA kinase n=1 Tax=Cellulomonas sp. 73-145 TaxID=1895739 RepID=UPI000926B203|nr:dephospho-CoA kinase [Cellulomonas sp. 73-145]OJV60954.1 MAG: dephospho-CoA kinase [Cellulomonas sp. 73-145]
MQRIGLTGGIAAGKSVAARRFIELGAVLIDADALAREVVAPGTLGLEQVVETFGPEVLAADGSLDRAALAARVFGDAEARRRLEALLHPQVRRLAAEREAAAAAIDPDAVVVHDIPLLVETGQAETFGMVVVVHAPQEQRVSRLVDGRGMPEAEARARVAAQAEDDARLAAADVVLDGTGTDDELRHQVDVLWSRLAQERSAERDADLASAEEHRRR